MHSASYSLFLILLMLSARHDGIDEHDSAWLENNSAKTVKSFYAG